MSSLSSSPVTNTRSIQVCAVILIRGSFVWLLWLIRPIVVLQTITRATVNYNIIETPQPSPIMYIAIVNIWDESSREGLPVQCGPHYVSATDYWAYLWACDDDNFDNSDVPQRAPEALLLRIQSGLVCNSLVRNTSTGRWEGALCNSFSAAQSVVE